MCGICGLLMPQGQALPDQELLDTVMRFIEDRGPDGQGEHRGDGIWFGHTRLSIIDRMGGHQPMESPGAKPVVVTFNGEIWNYRELQRTLTAHGHDFKTRCDTEVLLHGYREWGESLPEHLDGMFAFAIWDSTTGQLLLARDRFGEKPLFFAEHHGRFAFASDCRSVLKLLGLRPELDRERLPEFLLQRYVTAPNSLFKSIRKLAPGHLLMRSRTQEVLRPYWSVDPDPLQAHDLSDSELRGLLDRAVERRLMSDVPIGVFLSGGVDSAAVLAMAHAHGRSLSSFTIGFKDPRYDERPLARAAAQHFGTNHHEVEMDPKSFGETMARLAGHRDEPIAEPSEIPLLLLADAAADKVKVVLTGDGGDEIFGGYPKYRAERLLRRAGVAGAVALALGASTVRLRGSHRQLGRAIETARIADHMLRWISWFRSFSSTEIEGLLGSGNGASAIQRVVADARTAIAPYSDVDQDRQLLILDMLRWLPDNMLARTDKVLMVRSLEGRAPFVDRDLAMAVAHSWSGSRMDSVRGKSVLRDTVSNLLPSSSLRGPKRGFTVPMSNVFDADPGRRLERLVTSDTALDRGFLDADYVRRMAEASNSRDNSLKLFTLASLELWHRCHIDESSPHVRLDAEEEHDSSITQHAQCALD